MQKVIYLIYEYYFLFNSNYLVYNYYLTIFNFSFHPQDLILRGDVSFGAREQFENEAKMAVRLANFISAFLQVNIAFRKIRKKG